MYNDINQRFCNIISRFNYQSYSYLKKEKKGGGEFNCVQKDKCYKIRNFYFLLIINKQMFKN